MLQTRRNVVKQTLSEPHSVDCYYIVLYIYLLLLCRLENWQKS